MDLSRLRSGEIVAACGALALLVLFLLASWGRITPAAGGPGDSLNGWSALPGLKWLLLVAIVAALALAFLQATREAPAIPVVMSVLTTVIGGLATIALAWRLATTDATLRIGAWAGLLATIVLTGGAFLSLRQEGGWKPGREHPIEKIRLGPGTG